MALPKFGKDFKSTAIAGGFAAMMAVLPAAAANADEASAQTPAQQATYSQTREERNRASIYAGEFGWESQSNIGFTLYFYGSNEGTPDQYGEALVEKVEAAAAAEGHDFDAEYYVVYSPDLPGGIAVEINTGPGDPEKPSHAVNFREIYTNPKMAIDQRLASNKFLKEQQENLVATTGNAQPTLDHNN